MQFTHFIGFSYVTKTNLTWMGTGHYSRDGCFTEGVNRQSSTSSLSPSSVCYLLTCICPGC